jgi:Arc/MetJ family transcription regulator
MEPYHLLQYGCAAILIFPMKMTMHIDEDVLDRVMKITGASTKKEAVEIALKEMARRHKMKELFSAGLGLTSEEMRDAFDPASLKAIGYDFRAAEEGGSYGKSDPA